MKARIKTGKIPSVDGIYSTRLNRRTLFYRRDGKYWYTTSGDPRKEMVTWSLCEKPNLIAEWAWIERDGMPKPETKQELMSKAPLFGVDGEATR